MVSIFFWDCRVIFYCWSSFFKTAIFPITANVFRRTAAKVCASASSVLEPPKNKEWMGKEEGRHTKINWKFLLHFCGAINTSHHARDSFTQRLQASFFERFALSCVQGVFIFSGSYPITLAHLGLGWEPESNDTNDCLIGICILPNGTDFSDKTTLIKC